MSDPGRDSLEAARTLAADDDNTTSDADVDGSLKTVDPSHYVIGDDVARGGMGVVREARDTRTGRLVAVKELLGDPRPQQRLRFEREARITAQLQHPSIVPVYEVGQWPDGRPFFAMKLVGGRAFDVVVDEASDPGARLALVPRILPAVEAIAYAHEKGIIHRDLKPANVLLGEFGETIVIDWGLAKGIGDTDDVADARDTLDAANEDDTLTREGSIMGTPAYMPPEQARAEPLDARADVYSLGALLYHSLCGRPPYEGNALRQLLEGPPVPLSERAPNAPPDLVSIIDKAMARDRTERYRDARELARDLEAFQTGRLVGAYEYTSWELVTRFVRRNRALTWALASLVVLAVAAVVFIVREQQVAEAERERAVVAERRARGQERETHERLAQVHWQSAVRRLRRGDHLGAELFAAAAMAESPEHPRGPNRALRETTQVGDWLAGPAATWAAARALRFAKQARTFGEHEDWIYDVLVSDDDRWLVTTSADRRAVIWDLNTGHVQQVLEGHGGTVFQAALDSASARLATSAYDGEIRIWSFPRGELLRIVEHPADRVYGVCFAADGTLLGAGSDGQIAVFDADTGEMRQTIEATTAVPWRLLCPREASVAVLSSSGPEAVVVDLPSASVVRRIGGGGGLVNGARSRMRGLDLTPQEIVTVDDEGVLRRFDRTGGALVAETRFGDGYDIVTVSPDGRWLALAADEITIIDAESMRPVARFDGHEGRIAALAFNSSGSRLFSGGVDRRVVEWEIPTTREGVSFVAPSRGRIDVAVWSPDSHWLLAGGDDAVVRVWDARTGRMDHVFEGHTAPVRAAVFVDADTVATSGMDRTLRVHDLAARTSELVARLPHFGDALTLSPDRQTLAIASGDGAILLRDQASGALRSVPIADGRTWWVGFHPSGEFLASAGFDGHVTLIDAGNARVIRRWSAHEARIYDASWHPDGSELTTVDLEGQLRGWDPQNGERVRGQRLLDGEVARSVAWSPDGERMLVTTDRGARVYNARGVLEARLDIDERTTAASWTPDGRMIFATGGQVYVLPLDLNAWRQDPAQLLTDSERDSGTTLEALMDRNAH